MFACFCLRADQIRIEICDANKIHIELNIVKIRNKSVIFRMVSGAIVRWPITFKLKNVVTNDRFQQCNHHRHLNRNCHFYIIDEFHWKFIYANLMGENVSELLLFICLKSIKMRSIAFHFSHIPFYEWLIRLICQSFIFYETLFSVQSSLIGICICDWMWVGRNSSANRPHYYE